MNYYGIKRETYKNNGCMPCETVMLPNLFSTFENAVKFASKDADSSALRYGYNSTKDNLIKVQYSIKKDKCTTYRHEWNIIKFTVED